MSNRAISWAAALRELKTDRAVRSSVREERLRTNVSLRGALALAISVWRGRSGWRYVVVTQPLDALNLVAEQAAVVEKVQPQPLRHREHPLVVWCRCQHLGAEPLGP